MTSTVATVNSKGRVTIPKPVRDALGLVGHSKIVFALEDGVRKVVPLGRHMLTELAGSFRATRPWPGMEAVRDEVRREREPARRSDAP